MDVWHLIWDGLSCCWYPCDQVWRFYTKSAILHQIVDFQSFGFRINPIGAWCKGWGISDITFATPGIWPILFSFFFSSFIHNINCWQKRRISFNSGKMGFNVNTFLKSISTSKSRVTYDLDTTKHKIIGVVGSPLYLAAPVSTILPKSHLSL